MKNDRRWHERQLRTSLRLIRCMATVVSIVVFCTSLQSQSSQQNSDPRTVLNEVLTMMGGSSRWSTVSDATLQGTCQNVDLHTGAQSQAVPFQWINAGREFRYEHGAESELSVMLSGHGKPTMYQPSQTLSFTYETSQLQKPYHLPGLLLQSLLSDKDYRLEIIGDANSSNGNAVHIRATHSWGHFSEQGTRQDWWIDLSTNLPLRVVFRLPGQAVDSYLSETYLFSSWQHSGSLLFAGQVQLRDEFTAEEMVCKATTLSINTQPTASLFDAR